MSEYDQKQAMRIATRERIMGTQAQVTRNLYRQAAIPASQQGYPIPPILTVLDKKLGPGPKFRSTAGIQTPVPRNGSPGKISKSSRVKRPEINSTTPSQFVMIYEAPPGGAIEADGMFGPSIGTLVPSAANQVLTTNGVGGVEWATGGGGGGVSSVSAADGTVTSTPTTGAVTVAATGAFGSKNITTTGRLTGGAFTLTTGGGSGLVLTSDGSGNGTWQAAGGGGAVSSVTAGDGTVTVSPTTGSVVVEATGTFGAKSISCDSHQIASDGNGNFYIGNSGTISDAPIRLFGTTGAGTSAGTIEMTGQLTVGAGIATGTNVNNDPSSFDNGLIATDGSGNLFLGGNGTPENSNIQIYGTTGTGGNPGDLNIGGRMLIAKGLDTGTAGGGQGCSFDNGLFGTDGSGNLNCQSLIAYQLLGIGNNTTGRSLAWTFDDTLPSNVNAIYWAVNTSASAANQNTMVTVDDVSLGASSEVNAWQVSSTRQFVNQGTSGTTGVTCNGSTGYITTFGTGVVNFILTNAYYTSQFQNIQLTVQLGGGATNPAIAMVVTTDAAANTIQIALSSSLTGIAAVVGSYVIYFSIC